MPEIRELIQEGKGKRVYATDDPDLAVVYYKDEETGKCAMKIHLPKTESGIRIIPMLEIVEEATVTEYHVTKNSYASWTPDRALCCGAR